MTRRSRFFRRDSRLPGRPSIGAWLAYGLGSENKDLPAFVVMMSQGTGNAADQPLYDRLWGADFCRQKYQGVKFRSMGDPCCISRIPQALAKTGRAADSSRILAS